MDSYSASSLKQQSAGRHVAPLWHIILILSQTVFALYSQCCMLSREAINTNFIVFGLMRQRFKPTIYDTQGQHANHYTTDAVLKIKIIYQYHIYDNLPFTTCIDTARCIVTTTSESTSICPCLSLVVISSSVWTVFCKMYD